MTAKWCAPNRENSRITCYTLEQLKNIAREYNKNCSPKQRIKINGQTKVQLWNNIRQALSDKCQDEICWLNLDFIKKMNQKELKEAFRPKMPSTWKKENFTTWLNTDDINHVMKQYEKKYPDFIFIGAVPLDCGINSNLQCQLTNFDVNKAYKSGIRNIGIVYNTDTSSGAGKHWFSVYICLRQGGDITYYDSYAESAPNEIKVLMRRIQTDFKNGNNINLKLDYNKVPKQRDFYNCGIYSMFYIIKRLEGKSTAQIDRMKLDTKKMQQLKKQWYRNK